MSQPRIRLANTPTPLQELRRLREHLGGERHCPRLIIKRDDLTGLATGGNKTRKLEFLLADALQQDAGCLITSGGPQSNHCRQTAAAAARAGLDCHLVLGGEPPPRSEGNLFLDELLGAKLHWTPKDRRNQRMQELAEELRSGEEAKPCVVPIGGSNAVGALGYVAAMFELGDQLSGIAPPLSVDHIVFATSSGGTQAGMVLGASLGRFSGGITAISIDQVPDEDEPAEVPIGFCESVSRIANQAAERLGVPEKHFTKDDINLNYDYLGAGYGVVGDVEREAIKLLARTEGILTGPVYTGRALGGLLGLIRKKAFTPEETVLFWHTGDETALHAYAGEFV